MFVQYCDPDGPVTAIVVQPPKDPGVCDLYVFHSQRAPEKIEKVHKRDVLTRGFWTPFPKVDSNGPTKEAELKPIDEEGPAKEAEVFTVAEIVRLKELAAKATS